MPDERECEIIRTVKELAATKKRRDILQYLAENGVSTRTGQRFQAVQVQESLRCRMPYTPAEKDKIIREVCPHCAKGYEVRFRPETREWVHDLGTTTS